MLQRAVSSLSLVLVLVGSGCGGDDDPGGDGDGDGDAGSSADAAGNGADADVTAPDADLGGGADAANGVACGDTVCDPDSEVCCITQGSGPPPGETTTECTAPDACEGSAATCDGPEDCGDGEVCCGSFGGGGGGGGTGSAECTAETCQFTICHTADDCPNDTDQCCDYGFGSSICTSFCF
jgi:hypothetical protein